MGVRSAILQLNIAVCPLCALHYSILIMSACLGHIVSCSRLEFSMDPEQNTGNLGVDFSWQSLVNDSKIPYITHDGQIFLTQDPTDGTLSSTLYNVGRVSYIKPIAQLKDDHRQLRSFQTSFMFSITTTTKYNDSGDGIAFVMTTDAIIPPNSSGRFLGLMPESSRARHQRFLAVEFDTFQNLQQEIADPSASHIGIDINSLHSVAYLDTSSESSPLYLYHNYTFTAWVSYNASTHLIQVWATNSTSYPAEHLKDPVVTVLCNLSQVFEDYTDIYVGIVAASGNNSQATILYSWNFLVINAVPFNKLWYIIIVLGALVTLVAAATAYIVIHQQHQAAKHLQKCHSTIKEASSHGAVRWYRYAQLEKATQRFSEALVIGKGGFSTVYKGVLADGTDVAVKRMARDGLVRMPEPEMIAREVQIISKTRHRHLLQLKGWCYERGEALLVYDYMPRGSLDSYLYGQRRRSGQVMDSETRLKIILGVAAALEYLHGDMPGSERVLHRDVKAANVLLTDTMEAMLADFGLSRLIASNDQAVTITLAGTPGYVAPEMLAMGRVDDKADVYSFGVLALEVACGRKALDLYDSHFSRLVDWVWLQHKRVSILDALDPHLARSLGIFASSSCSQEVPNTLGPAVFKVVQKWQCVLHLGLLCCQAYPNARPRMREVHQALKEWKVLPPPRSWALYPAPSPSQSTPQSPSPIYRSKSSCASLSLSEENSIYRSKSSCAILSLSEEVLNKFPL